MDLEIRVLASSSRANCTYISDGASSLLLDAGLSLRETKQALDFKTSDLAGVLVTHLHQDHCRAVPDLLKSGIDCWMTEPTARALDVSGHRVRIIRPLDQFRAGPWLVLPFPTVHDAEGSVGFLLVHKTGGSRVLYLTDTAYCPYRFTGLTHVLIEANYDLEILRENVARGDAQLEHKKRILKNHLALETVKGFLRANDLSRVREIRLLHLSDSNSDAERFKKEIMELTGKPTFIAPGGG